MRAGSTSELPSSEYRNKPQVSIHSAPSPHTLPIWILAGDMIRRNRLASHGGHGTEWDTGMAGGTVVSRHAGPDGVGLPGIREPWPGRSESLPYHSMSLLRIITTAPERMPRLGWRTEDALRNTRNSKVVQPCRAY